MINKTKHKINNNLVNGFAKLRVIKLRFVYMCIFLSVLAIAPFIAAKAAQEPAKPTTCSIGSECLAKQIVSGSQGLKTIIPTDYAYTPPKAATIKLKSTKRTVNYSVKTRGNITADLTEFKAQANETLNNPLGWARMGITFNEVEIGGDFTLALSSADSVSSFGPSVCSADYSCQVGSSVIINQDRWLGATEPWNISGGSLRDYRNMVVNHETGHWLGHPHEYCSAAGNKAPVMQQQSISLQGCAFNAWPLDSELWSTRLGI